jgi:hypothetical protein
MCRPTSRLLPASDSSSTLASGAHVAPAQCETGAHTHTGWATRGAVWGCWCWRGVGAGDMLSHAALLPLSHTCDRGAQWRLPALE